MFMSDMSLFLVPVVFLFYFVSGKDRPGECFRNVWNEDLQTSERVNYCCDDYENRNGTCIECGKGYTSTDGRQCHQCKKQSFGKKCLQSCKCTQNQRCHHVEGCVNNLQSTTTQMTTEDYSTSVSLMTKMYEGKTENDERKKEEDNSQINSVFSQKIVVYSMCGAGLLIVITICYVFAKRLKYNRTTNRQNDNNGGNRLPEIPRDLPNPVLINQENLVQFESLYDEIDEISSDKNIAPERHDKTSVQSKSESSESDSEEKLEHDGYLNPYQQIVIDMESHDYNTAIADAGKLMEIKLKNRQETGYIDAISSNNPNERKYLELLDLQCMNCLNECEVIYGFNGLQLNPSKNMKCSVVEDVLICKKYSSSMFQLSSDKNTSKQKPELHSPNKRLSI